MRTEHNWNNTYIQVLEEYGEEAFTSRLQLLLASAKDFIHNHKVTEYISIDFVALEDAVLDYYADIYRLKLFHNINRVNPFKVASYTAYWLAKRKPLHLGTNPPDAILHNKPELREFNSWFASHVAVFSVFDRNKPELVGIDEKRQTAHKVYSDLSYFFTYRVFTPQTIELALLALDCIPGFEKIQE